MADVTLDAGRQNNVLKVVVVAVLLAAAVYGAYKFATARSRPGATAQATAQGAYYGSFTQHTHPAGTPAHGDGSTIAGAAGDPTKVLADRAGLGCPMGNGPKAPTKKGVTGEREEGIAQVIQGVQKIAVTVDGGRYSPNVIKLKKGLPAEITFGRSQGCTYLVKSDNLKFSAALLNGPQVVKLGGKLKKGTYAFSCGMNMVFGVIEVY